MHYSFFKFICNHVDLSRTFYRLYVTPSYEPTYHIEIYVICDIKSLHFIMSSIGDIIELRLSQTQIIIIPIVLNVGETMYSIERLTHEQSTVMFIGLKSEIPFQERIAYWCLIPNRHSGEMASTHAAGPVQWTAAQVTSPCSLFPYLKKKHLITRMLKHATLYLRLNHILLEKPTYVSSKTAKTENLSELLTNCSG